MNRLILLLVIATGCSPPAKPIATLPQPSSVKAEFLPLAKAELSKRGFTGELSDGSDAMDKSPVRGSSHFAAGKIKTADGVKPWSIAFEVTTFGNGKERKIRVVQVKVGGEDITRSP